MTPMNLEEAYRRAVARRREARTDLATACVPFLMHSTFRARTPPALRAALDDGTSLAVADALAGPRK